MKIAAFLMIGILALLCSCGGGGSSSTNPITNPPPNPPPTNPTPTPAPSQIVGTLWEIIGTVSGNSTEAIIEANLTEDTTGKITSSDPPAEILLDAQGTLSFSSCMADQPQSISGTVSGKTATLTSIDSGQTSVATGTIADDGKSITGTYTSTGPCGTSNGVFTAMSTQASDLNGKGGFAPMWVGTLLDGDFVLVQVDESKAPAATVVDFTIGSTNPTVQSARYVGRVLEFAYTLPDGTSHLAYGYVPQNFESTMDLFIGTSPNDLVSQGTLNLVFGI